MNKNKTKNLLYHFVGTKIRDKEKRSRRRCRRKTYIVWWRNFTPWSSRWGQRLRPWVPVPRDSFTGRAIISRQETKGEWSLRRANKLSRGPTVDPQKPWYLVRWGSLTHDWTSTRSLRRPLIQHWIFTWLWLSLFRPILTSDLALERGDLNIH